MTDRAARGSGASGVAAAPPLTLTGSALAGGAAATGGAVQSGRATPPRPSPSPEDVVTLRLLVEKLAKKEFLGRYGRAAELAGLGADQAFAMAREWWPPPRVELASSSLAPQYGSNSLCGAWIAPRRPSSWWGLLQRSRLQQSGRCSKSAG